MKQISERKRRKIERTVANNRSYKVILYNRFFLFLLLVAAQTAVFQLVFRISEEVHRFSLSKMDAVRRRKVRSVTLAKVPGIGERRAAALFKVFGTLENMAGASEEALAAVPTMNRSAARAVAEFFRDRGEGGKNKNNTCKKC